MKPCDLSNGAGQLAEAIATLKDRWIETKTHWTDENCRQFEKKYLVEIPNQLQFLLTACQRLTEILEKAESECEDHKETY